MKICCQLPISMPRATYEPYYDLLMKGYNLYKEGASEIFIRDVPSGLKDPGLVNYYGFRAINDVEIAKAMIASEAEGMDAVAGACFFDSGIAVADSLLDIPVVGAAKSTYQLASMMGEKIGVITSEPGWVDEMEYHLNELGFKSWAISNQPVRALNLPMADMFTGLMAGDFQDIINDFCDVADGLLSEGADVLIAGCGLISPVFTVSGMGEYKGAPIVDPMIASLKTAEMLCQLKLNGMCVKTKLGRRRPPSLSHRITGLKNLKMI